MELPDDILYYILSFIDKKYDNLRLPSRQRCLCKTISTNYRLRCKKKPMYDHFFCWHHNNLQTCEKLIAIK